jgi:acyl carrier protein
VATTFEKVADIIADTSEIERESITPESHTIDDLGIDSLDFLDIVFAIDKEFGIKIPLEQWTQDVNDGKVATEEYFVLKNLCDKIDDLGIDSLDFLDIVFAIDKEFGIKIPLEQWTQDVNDGKVATEEYFVLKNLCDKIDGLVAAKQQA